MLKTILALLAFVLYTAAGAWPVSRLMRDQSPPAQGTVLALGAGGLAAHTVIIGGSLLLANGLYLGFFEAASVVGWLMAALVLVTMWRRPGHNLTASGLPVVGLAVILAAFFGTPREQIETLPPGIGSHVYTSILAYSLLALAALQAILLAFQDRQLRHKHPRGVMRFLPPLQTMEELLFQTLTLGFVLLSLSLLTGFVFLDDMFAQHLVHKTVLSIVAWFVFGGLLLGHWRLGWRGRTAIRLTLAGFVLLMLAYFGSKFVLELILHETH